MKRILLTFILSTSFFISCENKNQLEQKTTETLEKKAGTSSNKQDLREDLITHIKNLLENMKNINFKNWKEQPETKKVVEFFDVRKNLLLEKAKKEKIDLEFNLEKILEELYMDLSFIRNYAESMKKVVGNIDSAALADSIIKKIELQKWKTYFEKLQAAIMCAHLKLTIIIIINFIKQTHDCKKTINSLNKWIKNTNDALTKTFLQKEIQFIQKKELEWEAKFIEFEKKLDSFIEKGIDIIISDKLSDDQKEKEIKEQKDALEKWKLRLEVELKNDFYPRWEAFLDSKKKQKVLTKKSLPKVSKKQKTSLNITCKK